MSIVIPYSPLPYQRELHNDPHRFRTIVAGRRSGKTVFSVNELIRLALTRGLAVPYWYIGPYYNQSKMIAWDLLLKYVPKELQAKKPHESELTVFLVNGATISLKGADRPSSLEGVALGALIVDEVASISHFSSLWEYSLRPMLADYRSPAIFISKPKGFNGFYDLAKRGDHRNLLEGDPPESGLDEDYMTFRFETEMNCLEHHHGYLAHTEIAHAERHMSPEAFAQEFCARFTVYSGLVHKVFRREIHVIEPFAIPEEWRRIRGWDFGFNHPTASLRIAIDPDDNLFVECCYKQSELSITDHAAAIHAQDTALPFVSGFGDPSGVQWMKEFRERGITIRAAHKDSNTTGESWVQLGIDHINQKLIPRDEHVVLLPDGRIIDHAPSLFIFKNPSTQLLVDELETLAYKENTAGERTSLIDEGRDKRGHFDLYAALRYAIVSYLGAQTHFAPVLLPDTEKTLESRDLEIKQKLNNPEERKKLELDADLAMIRQSENNLGIRR